MRRWGFSSQSSKLRHQITWLFIVEKIAVESRWVFPWSQQSYREFLCSLKIVCQYPLFPTRINAAVYLFPKIPSRGSLFFFLGRGKAGVLSIQPHLTQAMIFSDCIVPKIPERNFKTFKGYNDNFSASRWWFIYYYFLYFVVVTNVCKYKSWLFS